MICQIACGWPTVIVLALVLAVELAAHGVTAHEGHTIKSYKRELLQDIVTWDDVSSVDCEKHIKAVD